MKQNNKNWIPFAVISLFIVGAAIYYLFFFTPKNSLELYQMISSADNFAEVQKEMLAGYETHFNQDDFDFLNDLNNSPHTISQFTLLEYNQKTFVVMTTPGTKKLKILAVEELPDQIRQYFLELTPK